MSFLRKLFGGGKEPAKPERRRVGRVPSPAPTPAPGPAPSRPPPNPAPKPAPKPFWIADLPPSPKHFYLEYLGGASSKFYAVSLEEEEGGTWRVRFNFGRIGFPRAWDTRVKGATWRKASTTYMALVDEKLGKGYEGRRWPATLQLPDGSSLEAEDPGEGPEAQGDVLFRASRRGGLPPETGGSIGGVDLPDGTLYSPTPEGGSRGDGAVIWASNAPVPGVGQVWARLAAAFPETGVWPVVIDAAYGFDGFHDYLMDVPRGRHAEVVSILRKGWNGSVEDFDEDEPLENVAPFGRAFPGLADPTPGDRPTSIDEIVAAAEGHLGLVAVNRPADVLDAVGWMGAVNYDGDPLDMSTVLRSWEVRFDAYLVGLGTDTLSLAVGRPARDMDGALAISAEHYAFCPDNIDQGAESIAEYAPLIHNSSRWDFWWD
jgi:hypothetical protein